jgi:hypothetical protein
VPRLQSIDDEAMQENPRDALLGLKGKDLALEHDRIELALEDRGRNQGTARLCGEKPAA